MDARDTIYDENTFDRKHLNCPNCGWNGSGGQAKVANTMDTSKEVLCPKCHEYLGNLSPEHSQRKDRKTLGSQRGPG